MYAFNPLYNQLQPSYHPTVAPNISYGDCSDKELTKYTCINAKNCWCSQGPIFKIIRLWVCVLTQDLFSMRLCPQLDLKM